MLESGFCCLGPPVSHRQRRAFFFSLLSSFPFRKPKCWRPDVSPPPPPRRLSSAAAASLLSPSLRRLHPSHPGRARDRGSVALRRSRCWGWPAPSAPAPSATCPFSSPAPGGTLELPHFSHFARFQCSSARLMFGIRSTTTRHKYFLARFARRFITSI
jgi:hypothetical protein